MIGLVQSSIILSMVGVKYASIVALAFVAGFFIASCQSLETSLDAMIADHAILAKTKALGREHQAY